MRISALKMCIYIILSEQRSEERKEKRVNYERSEYMKKIIPKSHLLLICSIFILSCAACSQKSSNQPDITSTLTSAEDNNVAAASVPATKAALLAQSNNNQESREEASESGAKIKLNEKWTVIRYTNKLYAEYTDGNDKAGKILTYAGAYPNEYIIVKNTLIAAFDTGGSGALNAFYAVNYDKETKSITAECFEGCSYSVWLKDGFKGGISLDGREYEGEFSETVKEDAAKTGINYEYDGILKNPEHQDIEKSLYTHIIVDGNLIKTMCIVKVSTNYMRFGAVEMIYNVEDDGSVTQVSPPQFYTLEKMYSMNWGILATRR